MRTARIEPKIRLDDLARLLGGRKGGAFSSAVTKSIDVWSGRIGSLIEPHLSYVIRPLGSVDAAGITVDGETFRSSRISRTFRDCTDVVCFIATIDDGVEREVSGLMQSRKLSEAYILDSMGSVAVENMVGTFHERMEADFRKKGRSVTIRFSPGYCDWNIAEQKKLFRFFEGGAVPVTLGNESCLMGPRKSISGIFGVLPYDNGGVTRSYNPCTDCGKQGCIARRAKAKRNT